MNNSTPDSILQDREAVADKDNNNNKKATDFDVQIMRIRELEADMGDTIMPDSSLADYLE